MLLRSIVALVGIIELLAPRSFANFWLRLGVKNPEDVELRPWVTRIVRLEGLVLLGWVVWSSREQLTAQTGIDESIDVPDVEITSTTEESTTEDSDEVQVLREGTTRFDIASVLYHADDPLAVAEIVDLSDGTDWEVGRSTASATLYRMHTDGIVERAEREDGRGFEYWLSAAGIDMIEAVDGPVAPDPFNESD